MEKPSRIAVPSFATKRVLNREDKTFGIQAYDLDNLYPQRLRNAVNSSGTGTACANLLAKHLRGRGYKNQTLEDLVVNRSGQTLGEVHKLLAYDRALYMGWAYHIAYNAMLEVIEVTHVPFEYIRLTLPDDTGTVATVKVYPDWARESGKPIDRKKVLEYDLYTDDINIIQEQIEKAGGFEKWQGHIYYHSESGKGTYPPAVADSVFEDILTDAGIKMWKFRGISNDFMASYFWVFNGEFSSDAERQSYVDAVNSFQGVDNSHKVLVVECPVPASKPEIIPIQKQDNDKVYELTETTVRENIIRAHGQPLMLHAIHQGGSLGLSKEWEEAKKNYDERTADDRMALAYTFAEVMPKWAYGNPAPDGDYTVVPITGIPDSKPIQPLTDTMDPAAIAGVQAAIANPAFTGPQKVNILVAVYGVDPKVAIAMVMGTPLPIA
jgi:hypothetical protein